MVLESVARNRPATFSLLRALFAAAPSAVAWKNLEEGLAGRGDIDLLVEDADLPAVEREARSWLAARTTDPVLVCRHVPGVMTVVSRLEGRPLVLDIRTRGTWRGATAFTVRDALALSEPVDGIRRLRRGAEAVFTLVLNGMRGWGRGRPGRLSAGRLRALIEADPEGVRLASARLGLARGAVRRLVRAAARADWHRASGLLLQSFLVARIAWRPAPILQKVWFRITRARTCGGIRRELGGEVTPEALARWLPRHAERGGAAAGETGRLIMVTGPDGAGKTSLLLGLVEGVLAQRPSRWIHHRDGIGMLPERRKRGVVTRPHRSEPYPAVLSAAKVVYLWIELVAGWFVRLRPFVRDGGWVVTERFWWDMAVDQRRYRLRGVGWLVRLLGRLLPHPDLVIMLEGPPEVMEARKPELGVAEVERQLAEWRRAAPARSAIVRIDASAPLEDVRARAERALRGLAAWPSVAWTALPTAGRARVWIPRAPRRAAAGGLRVYHPLNATARVAWAAAWIATRLGLCRLLPRASPPPVLGELRRALAGAPAVAILRATRPGRYVGMGLDLDGRPRGIAKLALDDSGRAALAAEAAALERHAPVVGSPVRLPRVRRYEGGTLVMEPEAWRLRHRPWQLPTEVARALGRLYATGGNGAGGPHHGDCAPWNVLRTEDGWTLIDWENAGEGPPYRDLVHHLVQAHAYLGRPRSGAIVAGLRGRGPVAEAIEAYARAAGLPMDGAAAAMVALLRETQDAAEAHDPRAAAARTAKRRLLRHLERAGLGV